MIRMLTILALSLAVSLSFTGGAMAKTKAATKDKSITGVVTSLSTKSISIDTTGDKSQRITALINGDTKVTGDIELGATVSIAVSNGKATSISASAS